MTSRCFQVLALTAFALPLWAQGPGYSDRFASVVTGMGVYAADNANQYPPHRNPGDTTFDYYLPDVLTTPVSYLQPHQITDPFGAGEKYNRFGYFNTDAFSGTGNYLAIQEAHGRWGMWSIGPSRTSPAASTPVTNLIRYDATNGVLSAGVVFRSERILLETGSQ